MRNVEINSFHLALNESRTPTNGQTTGGPNVQQSSDGNQSQSSGMTMRKNTDVGNPDCTFSDPKFVQENDPEQSLVSSQS